MTQHRPSPDQEAVFRAASDALAFFRARLERLGVSHSGAFLYAAAFAGPACAAAITTDIEPREISRLWGQRIVDDVSEGFIHMSAPDRVTHDGVETAQ